MPKKGAADEDGYRTGVVVLAMALVFAVVVLLVAVVLVVPMVVLVLAVVVFVLVVVVAFIKVMVLAVNNDNFKKDSAVDELHGAIGPGIILLRLSWSLFHTRSN